jgi:hypothetical protein
MRRMKPLHALWVGGLVSAGCAALVIATVAAHAQAKRPAVNPKPVNPNELEVYLVRQDASDCTNANVPNGDSPLVGGALWLTKGSDGNTTVKVAITASPNTTYHFYLKCVRQLGDVLTSDEGVGEASFAFATGSVGNIYGFDSYPEGAPAGNKFQSVQVKWQ